MCQARESGVGVIWILIGRILILVCSTDSSMDTIAIGRRHLCRRVRVQKNHDVSIELLEAWSFGLIRRGWGVKAKDMEKIVSPLLKAVEGRGAKPFWHWRGRGSF